jgi:hypothetical protein
MIIKQFLTIIVVGQTFRITEQNFSTMSWGALKRLVLTVCVKGYNLSNQDAFLNDCVIVSIAHRAKKSTLHVKVNSGTLVLPFQMVFMNFYLVHFV